MTRTTTRTLTTLAAGLLSLSLMACASHQAKDAAATDPKTVAKAASAEKKEPGPQALGYAIMNSQGEPLYCKRMSTTGSNVARTTKCFTAKEWAAVHNNDQRTLEELRRGFDVPK